MCDVAHSIVLQALAMELGIKAKAWKIRVLPIHCVEVGGGRRLTADICVVASDRPLQEELRLPPLLCVEVVSPEDGAAAMDERVEEFLKSGVKTVWLIYPSHRKVYEIVSGTNRVTETQLSVPGTDILIYSSTIFAELREHELDELA